MPAKATTPYSTSDLVIEFILHSQKIGRPPKAREFGCNKAAHLYRRFGKWIYLLEHIGLWPSREELEELYVKQKLSCEIIRKMYPPLTKHTIRNICHRHGFKMRKASDYELPCGAGNPRWKGGRCLSRDGYMLIREPKGRHRLEHRIVMEKHLGRKLQTSEHVHHLNGIRHDNRIENLVIMEKETHHKEGHTIAKHQAKRIQELEKMLKIKHR